MSAPASGVRACWFVPVTSRTLLNAWDQPPCHPCKPSPATGIFFCSSQGISPNRRRKISLSQVRLLCWSQRPFLSVGYVTITPRVCKTTLDKIQTNEKNLYTVASCSLACPGYPNRLGLSIGGLDNCLITNQPPNLLSDAST